MTAPAALVCSICGAGEPRVVRARREVTAEDGTTLEFDDEFTRCEKCGVEYYTRDQSLAASRARAGALRAHEGLLSPQEIRAIREQLGYTQAQLEQALGVGPKTIVRWEKGTVRQSRLADRFLRTLAAYPHAIVYNTAFQTVQPPQNVVIHDPTPQTVFSYAKGIVVADGGVLHAGGISVFATTPMFISGGALQVETLWTDAVQIHDKAERESWELRIEDALPALCEAA